MSCEAEITAGCPRDPTGSYGRRRAPEKPDWVIWTRGASSELLRAVYPHLARSLVKRVLLVSHFAGCGLWSGTLHSET
jgi:hypothetical protein